MLLLSYFDSSGNDERSRGENENENDDLRYQNFLVLTVSLIIHVECHVSGGE